MKKIKHLPIIAIAVVLVAILGIFSSFADTIFSQNGFYYSRSSSTTADLYGRESTDADLIIPKDFSEYYIKNIVDSAFEDDTNIVSLSFDNAILLERIGFYAFKNCTNLSGQVSFNGRINSIGTSAFENCSSLESVRFNSYIQTVSDQCFYNCSSLSEVKFNDRVISIEKLAFANCTSLEYVEIPATVTNIAASAFRNDTNLTLGVYTDTYAHEFAESNNIPYILIDAPKLGDVNADGEVDVMDSLIIQKFAVDKVVLTDEELARADVNHDGFVDVTDALLIQKYTVGKYEIQ